MEFRCMPCFSSSERYCVVACSCFVSCQDLVAVHSALCSSASYRLHILWRFAEFAWFAVAVAVLVLFFTVVTSQLPSLTEVIPSIVEPSSWLPHFEDVEHCLCSFCQCWQRNAGL